MNRQETHNKLLELRARATRQPISYQPLFVEAVGIAADLLMELCQMESMADERATALVHRFEHESMALHRTQREWLEREIAKSLRPDQLTNHPPEGE